MAATSRHWIPAKKPTDHPVLSRNDATFRLVTKPIRPLKDAEVLVKVQYLSNDPAQRLWIDPNITPNRLCTRLVELNNTMASCAAISQVVESKSESLSVVSLASAAVGWCKYAVTSADKCVRVIAIKGFKPTDSVSIFSLAGVTTYYGLVDVVQTGAEDAVVISGAAGAVDSMAIQVAKNMLGCKKVIGITGTDAKCRWLETRNADVCLNYKSKTFQEDLKAATKGFVKGFLRQHRGQSFGSDAHAAPKYWQGCRVRSDCRL